MSTGYNNPLLNAPSASLLPTKEVAYTLGLGKIDVPPNAKVDVCITVAVNGGDPTATHFAGFVLSCQLIYDAKTLVPALG